MKVSPGTSSILRPTNRKADVAKKLGKVVVSKRKDGEWGVSIVFANGKTFSATEGYKNKAYAVKLANKVIEGPIADRIVMDE